jgi:RHS repeat-associated protein
MTTATGIISWQAQASAFGDTKIDMQIASTRLAAENNHRFPGQYYDAETGLHQNYFRDYEASIGRYVQRDPIGLDGGINVYGYVGGGPVGLYDSKGLRPIPPRSDSPSGSPRGPRFPGSSCGAEGDPNNFPNKGMSGTWSFESACHYHDNCYGACGADKSICDRAFKEIMMWECKKIADVSDRTICRYFAQAYYVAVDQMGDKPFKDAQKKACPCKK